MTWKESLSYPIGSLPVDEIHQSWLSVYRECHRKGVLYGQFKPGGKKSHNMFGGSIFHAAIEDAIMNFELGYIQRWVNGAKHPEYWREVFEKVFRSHPGEQYDVNYEKFAVDLASPSPLRGVTVAQIIYNTLIILRGSGFKIIACEKELHLPMDGHTPFHGTIDMVLQHRSYKDSQVAIVDTKTSGMWQAFFKGKAPSTQSYDVSQVMHHQQLIHYGWMGWRGGHWTPEDIIDQAIYLPVNMTYNLKGPKAGQMRGEAIFWAKPEAKMFRMYEEDLAMWLRMMNDGLFPRLYPGLYGKINCGRCAFHRDCFDDAGPQQVPDYLLGDEEF